MGELESTARGRQLGEELRRRRERAGLNGVELARRIGWSPSTVSRMEAGLGNHSEVKLTAYLAHCGTSAPDAAEVLRLGEPGEDGYLVRRSVLRTLVLHESTAVGIRETAPLLVPGLLQTEDYARAVMHLPGSLTEDEIAARVAVRMDRQTLLRRRWPPRFTYLIYEPALRCPLGGDRVMHEQMLHLVFLSSRPQMTIRVVRLSDGARAAHGQQFALMEYADHGPVLYAENTFAGMFVENREDVETSRAFLDGIAGDALNEGQSREFLAALASDYDRPDGGAP
ncbi:transcriptional regulator [Amycolatopsis antarctica]|uniref:Transcriptional regulator n=1 Tax=Amycolatopsis antarctica TaxID=1854586 RepID=A0A263D742_9PSEU|nr:helix-turn-helix transcriptional regulator [Amycolatopsis antarctica]OZM73838.1 transcriptional regulator [Amycolatopsis antarctica]